MGQNALTIITRILPDQIEALGKLLDEIGGDITGNSWIRFHAIKSVQFACWVILKDDPNFPPILVMESSHDGDTESHLNDLVTFGMAGLNAIYSKCEGFPFNFATAEQMKLYLNSHSVSTPAFYIGVPGQSLPSIQNAIDIRKTIENFLDTVDLTEVPLSTVQSRIQQHLKTSGINPQISPITLDQQASRAKRNLILLIIVLAPLLLLLSPIWFPLLIIYVIVLRKIEKADAAAPQLPPLPIDPRLFDHEDIFVQNHLTTLVNVKPGKFRLGTLKVILWIISLLAKIYFITGQLGGIPTIHFARWILMDNDRRLLFFSNYDGSWASYLGDFVDKANYGLTSVWSNTESFPPAKFLFWGGAQHIEEFKQWSRQHNVLAPVWYSAYPDETLWNLQKDIQIRDTINTSLNRAELETLLQRF